MYLSIKYSRDYKCNITLIDNKEITFEIFHNYYYVKKKLQFDVNEILIIY